MGAQPAKPPEQASVQSFDQQYVQSPVQNDLDVNDLDASDFSFETVLGNSFSIFFRHSLVFVGLTFLSQMLGFSTTLLTRMRPGMINLIFGLAIQGAIIYGAYDALQGRTVRFGRTLSKGFRRCWSLFCASIALGICSFFLYLFAFFVFINKGVLFTVPIFFLMLWLWCLLSMYAPACVVEHLEPMGSLFRSSILTKDCLLKIAGLYFLCFSIMIGIVVVSEVTGKIFTAETLGRSVIQQFVIAVPMAFFHVTTAVIYYELLYVKEGTTLDRLESVINDAVDYVGY